MDKLTSTVIDAMPRTQKHSERRLSISLPVVSLVLGILLIGLSLFPLGFLASEPPWTVADSAAYDRITQEYKRSAYQSTARSGFSEKEMEVQRERMKQQMGALEEKLEYAKEQPKRWSRYLFWAGVVLVVGGFWGHRRG